MRIIRYQRNNKVGYGILEADKIRELVESPFGCLENIKTGAALPLESCRLLAPVSPPNILAIGLNYRLHAQEGGHPFPKEPIVFSKTTTSLAGNGSAIVLPKMAPGEVDYEGELALVIRKTARNITPEKAFEYLLGSTCANDVSARDCQMRLDRQWTRGKSFDTFCPVGPWIETDVDPDNLLLETRVNGQVVQKTSTSDMIFNCRTLISYLSRCMTLLPGTLILTGTPSGVGYNRRPQLFFKNGDVVEVEIEKIGLLRNNVIAE